MPDVYVERYVYITLLSNIDVEQKNKTIPNHVHQDQLQKKQKIYINFIM